MEDMEQQILVAVSGGIDSTAAVIMLREQGFSPVGLYIDMLGDQVACDKVMALAQKLEMQLHIEHIADEFRHKIIEHTISEHVLARTPSPCAVCNPLIKWDVTKRVADRLGIHNFATGHYVRVVDGAVYKGVDPTKDQSYYLWGVSPEVLRRARTPLGGYTKKEVREFLLQREGFGNLASGGESMSICFLNGVPYNRFITENLECRSGEVVDKQGRVVGTHDGYQLYTIGQKRGFTGGGSVMAVDAARNRIVVTTDMADLYTDRILIRDWVLHSVADIDRGVMVKVRGLGRNPQSLVVGLTRQDDGCLLVELAQGDAFGVASGQPLVFYDGERVLGGGVICDFQNK